ncbi:hypothetical protein [Sediminitomix flava]|uniref:Uncharacterized protein n=1 Tax=Sediminitomix flava TaxID=379075 RepID=A0A315ZIK7_SEDFL|nr:hypothetical protein [Sediminitomix flava]PWJ45039.1 hypothetical protein BC781_1011442 [Sediminitomix flava]
MKKSVFSIKIGKQKKFFDNTNKSELALYRSQFERAARISEYLEQRTDKALVEALRDKYFTELS